MLTPIATAIAVIIALFYDEIGTELVKIRSDLCVFFVADPVHLL